MLSSFLLSKLEVKHNRRQCWSQGSHWIQREPAALYKSLFQNIMSPRCWLWIDPTVETCPCATFNRSAAGCFSQPDAQCLWGIQAATSIKFNFSRKDLSSVTKKILQYLHLILFTRLPYIALGLWLGVKSDCTQFSEDVKNDWQQHTTP